MWVALFWDFGVWVYGPGETFFYFLLQWENLKIQIFCWECRWCYFIMLDGWIMCFGSECSFVATLSHARWLILYLWRKAIWLKNIFLYFFETWMNCLLHQKSNFLFLLFLLNVLLRHYYLISICDIHKKYSLIRICSCCIYVPHLLSQFSHALWVHCFLYSIVSRETNVDLVIIRNPLYFGWILM